MTRQLNFVQFCNERGVVDPTVDILALGSPSGRMSKRARKAAGDVFQGQLARLSATEEEYSRLVDAGTIVDPTGHSRQTPWQTVPNPRIADLERRIAMLQQGCQHALATGRENRVTREIAAARVEIATLPPTIEVQTWRTK